MKQFFVALFTSLLGSLFIFFSLYKIFRPLRDQKLDAFEAERKFKRINDWFEIKINSLAPNSVWRKIYERFYKHKSTSTFVYEDDEVIVPGAM